MSSSQQESPAESNHGRLTLSALGSSTQYPSATEPTASRRLFRSSTSVPMNHSHAPPPRHLFCRGDSTFGSSVSQYAVGDCPSTQERLDSLLESYSTPAGERMERQEQAATKPVYRVKFKPPLPRFTRTNPTRDATTLTRSGIELQYRPHEKLIHSSLDGSLYESFTSGLGPHEWENCPRRSPKRVRSQSAPSSPGSSSKSPKRYKSSTLPNQIPLETLDKFHLEHTDPKLTPLHISAPDLRPPFVVRHADPALLERRNFCGESCCLLSTTKHQLSTQKSPLSGTTEDENERGDDLERQFEDENGLQAKQDGETFSGMYNRHLTAPTLSPTQHTSTTSMPHCEPFHKHSSLPPKSPLKSSFHRTTTHPRAAASKSAPTSPYKSQTKHCSVSSSSVPRRGGVPSSLRYNSDDALVAKYLVSQPGNTRAGVGSPLVVIQEKLERLRRECCECLVSVCLYIEYAYLH